MSIKLNRTKEFYENGFKDALSYIKKSVVNISESTISIMEIYTNKCIKNLESCNYIDRVYTKTYIVKNSKYLHIPKMEKENKIREAIHKYIFIRFLLRNLTKMTKIRQIDRLRLYSLMCKLPLRSCSTRARNRDILSGYPRSFCRMYGISRHSINEKHGNGSIPGLSMYTW